MILEKSTPKENNLQIKFLKILQKINNKTISLSYNKRVKLRKMSDFKFPLFYCNVIVRNNTKIIYHSYRNESSVIDTKIIEDKD